MYSLVNSDGSHAPAVALETMRAWIYQGAIRPDTSVVDPIYGTVREAGQIPELEQIFRERDAAIQASMQKRASMPGPAPGASPYGQAPQGTAWQGQSSTNPFDQAHPAMQDQNRYAANPYAGDAGTQNRSDKDRGIALILAILTGPLGVHRMYVGDTGGGLAMLALALLGGCLIFPWFLLGIWWLFDIIMIISGKFRDRYGRRLT